MRQSTNLVVWLTKKEIKKAAMKGLIAAKECSALHWRQIKDAGPEEFYDAKQREVVSTSQDYCALCQRYWNGFRRRCEFCPIHNEDFVCCEEYEDANELVKEDTDEGKERWSPKTLEAIDRLIERIEGR